MRAYVATTAVIFGLIIVAHLVRVVAEPHLATDPFYILLTAAAAALCIWAWRIFPPVESCSGRSSHESTVNGPDARR